MKVDELMKLVRRNGGRDACSIFGLRNGMEPPFLESGKAGMARAG